MAKIQNGCHFDTNFPTTSLLDHVKANCCGKIYVCMVCETIEIHNHTDGVLVYRTITPQKCFAYQNNIFASTYFILRSTRMAYIYMTEHYNTCTYIWKQDIILDMYIRAQGLCPLCKLKAAEQSTGAHSKKYLGMHGNISIKHKSQWIITMRCTISNRYSDSRYLCLHHHRSRIQDSSRIQVTCVLTMVLTMAGTEEGE